MPRVRLTPKEQNELALTAYPELRGAGGATAMTAEQLRSLIYARPPDNERYRKRYGRALDLARIEQALRSAQDGYMRDLTDLSREMISLDPHLSAVVAKRINAVASVPFEIVEASGSGVDPKKAELYAQVVREQIEKIPNFRQRLKALAWGLYDGRSLLENHWLERPRDSRGVSWHLAELAWIHPRRLQFGPDREIRINDSDSVGFGFAPLGVSVDDPRVAYKFVQFKPQLFGEYPEREGLAPRCLYWAFFKRFGARDRMILLELFGKPWRIVTVDENSNAGDVELAAAEEAADQLGDSRTARMPRGVKLTVEAPDLKGTDLHNDVIGESDRQLSKLVLGQTGTTDPMAGGLNGQQSSVMQDEQMLILKGDCEILGDSVEDGLTDAIIALNYGPSEVMHAPRFVLRAEMPPNREKEAERVKKALDAGLSVSIEEAYEVIGFRKPEPNEDSLQMGDITGPFGTTTRAPVIVPGKSAEDADRLGNALKEIGELGTAGGAGTGDPPPGAPPAGAAPSEGGAPAEGGLLNKSDMKIITKVNEARKDAGLPPLTLPGGAPDPDGDLTVSAYEAKQKAQQTIEGEEAGKDKAGVVDPVAPPPGAPGVPPPPPGQQPPVPAPAEPKPPAPPSAEEDDEEEEPKPKVDDQIARPPLAAASLVKTEPGVATLEEMAAELRAMADELGAELLEEVFADLRGARTARLESIKLEGDEKMRQPESINGSIEDVIDRGVRQTSVISRRWTSSICSACEGKTDARSIWKAIKGAVEKLDVRPFAMSVERQVMHGAMTGALDSQYEATTDEVVKPEPFTAEAGYGSRVALAKIDDEDEEEDGTIPPTPGPEAKPRYTRSSYREAIKHFKLKRPVSKSSFDRMSAAAKQRSFTVAGLASDHALKIAKSELERAIVDGRSLSTFAADLSKRFELAGFSVPNPSHLETVFRTNVLGAYNSGRKIEMSEPETIKLRPFWRIRTVGDARRRDTHGAVDGWLLRADDSFWRKKGGPPWGFNCRCRVSSVSAKRAEGESVRNGAEIRGLPDTGFDASTAWVE